MLGSAFRRLRGKEPHRYQPRVRAIAPPPPPPPATPPGPPPPPPPAVPAPGTRVSLVMSDGTVEPLPVDADLAARAAYLAQSVLSPPPPA